MELFCAKFVNKGPWLSGFSGSVPLAVNISLYALIAESIGRAEAGPIVRTRDYFAFHGHGETGMAVSAGKTKKSNKSDSHSLELEADYIPHEGEEFMNPKQLAYFAKQLNDWRNEILADSRDTLSSLQEAPIQEADPNDRASSETDWGLELRTRDRQRKLIAKIDAALRRIDENEYGYCQVTGEPISLGRLRARPIATMTLEAQERHERNERISRDD